MRTLGQRPNPNRSVFLVFLASLFSLRDLPTFLPDGFCGDFSGMWGSISLSVCNLRMMRKQGGEEIIEWDRRHTDGSVTNAIGNHQSASMDDCTT
jgi:hypothetical protein